MMISTENAGKITEERKFSCVVCREGLGSNFRFAGAMCIWDAAALRGKLKEDSQFNCKTRGNQQSDITEDCSGI